MRKNQKGFTLVELLVVIAIIAILATVSVVGYVSLIDRANQSVDEQAVTQINKALEALEITDGKFTDVAQVIKALSGMDLDIEDYKPLKSGMYFYWDAGLNRVVYADASDKIVYPEDTKKSGQWMSLSGLVPMDSGYDVSGTTATVTSGAQLAHLLNNLSDNITTIKLSGEIDMRGATLGIETSAQNITLEGDSNTVLKGLRIDTNAIDGSWAGENKTFGYALFGNVAAGHTVTVKNISISGAIIENTEDGAFGHSAILFGKVEGTVNIENVKIDNCKVIGGDKVGSLIGYLTGSANIKNVTVTNTELYGLGYIATAIGCVSPGSTRNIETVDCSGVKTGINEDEWSKLWNGDDKNWVTNKLPTPSDVKAYVDGSDNTYMPYLQNGKIKTESGEEQDVKLNNLEGMCTKDLYWVDNKAFNNGVIIDEYKIEIEGKIGGFKISSADGGKVE